MAIFPNLESDENCTILDIKYKILLDNIKNRYFKIIFRMLRVLRLARGYSNIRERIKLERESRLAKGP